MTAYPLDYASFLAQVERYEDNRNILSSRIKNESSGAGNGIVYQICRDWVAI